MDEFSLDGKVIAAVDDHEIVLKAMRGFLEAYGATVLTYKNGRDFLMATPFVDCLIVDYYMPEFHGLDLISELRKRAYGAAVVILTGMSNEVPEERVAELEVRHVVEKSSGYQALLRAVSDCCSGQRE